MSSIHKHIFITLALITATSANAQRQNGYVYSNYSGSIGATVQPAFIADSPYKFDINLIDFSGYVTNNVGSIQKTTESYGFARYINNEDKFIQYNAQGSFGLMLSLPNKQGINFRYGLRTVGSNGMITPSFISSINRFGSRSFLNTTETDEKIQFNAALWEEIAFTYARVLVERDGYQLKAGITLKGIDPLGGAWLDISNADYQIDGVGNAVFSQLDMSIGFSESLAQFQYFEGTEDVPNRLPSGSGFKRAVDVGAVLEFLPKRAPKKSQIGTRIDREINYSSRISISITDIGKMTFQEAAQTSFFSNQLIDPNRLIILDSIFQSPSNVREVRQTLESILVAQNISGAFSMSLPTALHINYDYNTDKNWFFNLATQIDLSDLMSADYQINYPSSVTLTPRYETGEKGMYLPIFYNFDGDLDIGFGFRYGPLTLGTQSLEAIFDKEKTSGGLFFSLNLRQLVANSYKPYCFGSSNVSPSYSKRRR